ncbi:MAG: VWA domain-containing protein, partial [Pyrinomonadaceae bacterium]
VNPNEVPSNLRERPLTEAAKAIIRSGDSLLTEAIRRASPKFFGDYAKTLPPLRREPTFSKGKPDEIIPIANIKKVLVQVTDLNNRAIGGLEKSDFEVLESGREREIISVEPTDAPFNLVLLLDVSGSVDNYVDFIRKSARNFVNTVDPRDKVAIVIFNEDIEVLSNFSSYKQKLSESLDSFDAGGGTAYYDALAYTLTETLKPLRGERTAIVVLSDGDDNRSFLPFDSLLGSIQESGALIYPLYVPSGLIAATATSDPTKAADPLRMRYLSLTSKAETEGEILAKISGGVYYPITQISQLQKAYEDIVVQLRTAYTVKFRSDVAETRGNGSTAASPRLKVKVKRENSFVKLGSVVEVPETKSQKKNTEIKNEISKEKPNVEVENIQITGEITGIEDRPLLTQSLKESEKRNFDINNAPPAFILSDGQRKIAVSRWVSPKRTRSYPYERVYNTLSQPKRITIIPVVKDEGAKGDRDFIQFDTFSLMSLLEVFVIPAYYNDADKAVKEGKITNQKFDNDYVLSKIIEVENYQSSAQDWNLKQLGEISGLLEKASNSYKVISEKTGIIMHGEQGIINFSERIKDNLDEFRMFSRLKAQNAQTLELKTLQPKESLSSDTKGRVTITDNLGGKYYFTCDETRIENDTIFLIEAKHSSRAKMPGQSDIKDGILKMILYSNLKNVRVGNVSYKYKPVLRLTSGTLKGEISSDSSIEDFDNFSKENLLTKKQKDFLNAVFTEAKQNRFVVKLESSVVAVIEDLQNDLQIS